MSFQCAATGRYFFVQQTPAMALVVLAEVQVWGSPFAGADTCAACVAGQYSTTGSSVCTQCSSGQYTSIAGQSACTPCPAGTYFGSTRAAACLACLSGQGPTGASACTVSLDSVLIQAGSYYDLALGAMMAYYPFNPAQPLADASGRGLTLTTSNRAPTAVVGGPWAASLHLLSIHLLQVQQLAMQQHRTAFYQILLCWTTSLFVSGSTPPKTVRASGALLLS